MSSGPTCIFISKDFYGQQNDSSRNRGVRNIESRPVIVAEVKFEEINDIAVAQSVIKVPERAAQDACEGNLQQPVSDWTSKGINDDDGDGGQGEQGQ